MHANFFTALTFNILGDWDDRSEASWVEREAAVMRAISESQPDIAGLQEVTETQRVALDTKLPEMRRIPINEHTKQNIPHMEDPLNTILYRPTRFDYEEGGVFWLGLDPSKPRLDWDAAFPRCTTWARFIDRKDGMPVLFISTHLDHDSARAQDESSRQILKFLGSASGGPSNECPTIVVGDFNSDASGEIHQRFVKGPPVLYDAWEETHGGPGKPYENGTFHDFTGKALGEVGRIDWILFNRPLKPIEAGLLRTNADGRYPSDHFPVFATFIKT